MREAGFIAAIGFAIVGAIVLISMVMVAGNDCSERGGHEELDHWMLVGKVMVPVDKCVGAAR